LIALQLHALWDAQNKLGKINQMSRMRDTTRQIQYIPVVDR
jgi:hypothetical protein